MKAGISFTRSKSLFEALVFLLYCNEKAVKIPQLGVSASHALNAVFKAFPRSNSSGEIVVQSLNLGPQSCFPACSSASSRCIGHGLFIYFSSFP